MTDQTPRHALYGPSGAERWVSCPASIARSIGHSSPPNQYSALGSFAHSIAAACLDSGLDPVDFVGMDSHEFAEDLADDIAAGFVFEWNDEHAQALTLYTAAIRERAEAATQLLVETRVDLSDALGVPEQFGTADAMLINKPDRSMSVEDLKFGIGQRVDADDNWQLILYALGALMHALERGIEIDQIELVIHQPRLGHVSRETYSADDIIEFGNYAAEQAQRAESIRIEGIDTATDADYGPGEKACRWCSHFAECSYAEREVSSAMEIDEAEFTDLTLSTASAKASEAIGDANEPPDERAARLSRLLRKLDYVDLWSKTIRSTVYRLASEGVKFPDWKLVAGRKGNRAWSDPETAGELLSIMGFDDADIYGPRKLKTPKQIIDTLNADELDADDLGALLELVRQGAPTPTLAHSSDDRPELETESLDDLITPLPPES